MNDNLKKALMEFGDYFSTFVAMTAIASNEPIKAELLLTSVVSAIIKGWPVNIINKEYDLEIMDDSRKGDGVYMFNHYVYPKAAEIYAELWKECCSYIKDTWVYETFEKKCSLCITDLMELLLNFLVPYIYKRTNIRSSGQLADRMFSNSEMYECFISTIETPTIFDAFRDNDDKIEEIKLSVSD